MGETERSSPENVLLVDVTKTREGAFAVDEERRIVFWNRAAEELLGYRAEEALGYRCCELLHDAGGAAAGTCARCLAGGAPSPRDVGGIVRGVSSVVTRDGAVRSVQMTTMLAHNANGRARIVHIVRDASHEARASAANGSMATQSGCGTYPRWGDDTRSTRPDERGGPTPTLTKREYEVLRLLANGCSTGDIADTLGISPITARNHVTSVIEKLDVKTRLQAVVVAARKGLL